MTRAWLLLLVLVLIWGSHWVVVKIGLESIPPFTYGVLRLVSGMAVLLLLLAATGRVRPPHRGDWPVVVSFGLLYIFLLITAMNLALEHVPAGRSSILAFTIPLWVVPLMALVVRVLPTRAEVIGLVLGMGGLVLLLNPAAIDWSSTGAVLGSLLLVLGAMGAAVAMVHIRLHRWQGTPNDTQFWQLGVALIPMTALMLLLEGGAVMETEWDLGAVMAVLFSGVLATAFAFWAAQMLVRALGPLTTGIGYLGAPVVGVITGIMVLGEVITLLDIAGIAVTTAGIVIVLVAQQRARERASPPPT